MSRSPWIVSLLALCAVLPAGSALAQGVPTARFRINADRPGPVISPMMHGIFFEDINFGADGGLYAELIQNRSFEDHEHLYSWSEVKKGNAQGSIAVESVGGMNASNPTFLRASVQSIGAGYGVANTGFGGIAVRVGESYNFAIRARANEAFRANGSLMVLLQDPANNVLGEARITGLTGEWKEYKAAMRASSTQANAKLVILVMAPGQVDLDVVSLFPEKTFKNRANGMRPDLARMLADMKPAFMRFPGGCIIEGDCQENMYRWKETIGDIAERKQNHNRWMDAVPTKSPHYYQTFGLGFFEYFQLCEDIGAEPLPVVNCGMTCQFQPAKLWFAPLSELGPFIQDALDLIEFANGPVNSTWGKKRAEMGHPGPFNMKYLAIGNEQWGEDYFPRYKMFHDAIKAKYPQMNLVTSSGPAVDDVWWNLAWGKFRDKSAPAEIVDEHYYRPPRWFYEHASRYDKYDRSGPKVFAGEFAAHGLGLRNNLHAALAESAFMTGLLRNADVVSLASYAPLFAKIGDTQWVPDMIWFTNTTAYGSPSYHAAVMFGQNVGNVVLPIDLDAPTSPGQFAPKGLMLLYENCVPEFRNLKVTSGNQTLFAPDFANDTSSLKPERGEWTAAAGVLRSVPLLRGRISNRLEMPSTVTITVEARKTSGPGGFGIKALGEIEEIAWWLGARANTRNEMQFSFDAYPVDGKIEEGRWYQLKLELDGRSAKAYIDGQLAIQRDLPTQKSLFAVATRDNASREVILKAVNPTAQPLSTTLQFAGMPAPTAGRAIVMSSSSPLDENSLETPAKIVPKESAVSLIGDAPVYVFPPYSVTVLRLRSN